MAMAEDNIGTLLIKLERKGDSRDCCLREVNLMDKSMERKTEQQNELVSRK